MLIAEGILVPTKVWEDIISPESKRCILNALIESRDTKRELQKANNTIVKQDAYIAELEQKVDDLQKALDTVLLNKCRTRKVKVKVYGRSPMDKVLHRNV